MNILILGATGMLGYSLFANLSDYSHLKIYGTARSIVGKESYFSSYLSNIIIDINADDINGIERVINSIKPNVVINCIGLIKQHEVSKHFISAIKINSLLPHQLADLCNKYNARLIHFSTDCVFDGKKGLYDESDLPNATDLYGKSKCLGEVGYERHLTLRTSIIGHELLTSVSLVDWFLKQSNEVNGYTNAVFSGLPTCYIAKLLAENILNNEDLSGLYHLSGDPINKFSLLTLISEIYGKTIKINKSEELVIDRSLISKKIRDAISFIPPDWNELIKLMHNDYQARYKACKN